MLIGTIHRRTKRRYFSIHTYEPSLESISISQRYFFSCWRKHFNTKKAVFKTNLFTNLTFKTLIKIFLPLLVVSFACVHARYSRVETRQEKIVINSYKPRKARLIRDLKEKCPKKLLVEF